ncbi:hypothetical protein FACS1894164_11200 [Spirochaetia bacterium]|nr:hypothetical protein FACS1894164_11200 [Spirochaetia bacterium]
MKYGELIQFEALESVIQLRNADKSDNARRLVETFIISDEMAERITGIIIPQMQYTVPADNKGILIVGNYGTGKSHLMSVLSSVAEDASLAHILYNRFPTSSQTDNWKSSLQKIAGQFKVIRAEISSQMSLRDIIVSLLEESFEKWNIDYHFPPAHSIVNNKNSFEDMMAAFEKVFPDQGLLLIIDELLDYLRSRNDQELILDLNFLREIGEICKDLRFRFMAGVQEAIFDNPRFSFAADSIRRVKDRFEQIRIARNDIKFVVAQRLLKKNAEQQTKICNYLSQFTRYYGNLNERIDEFVRLFPIHPDYIDTFERIKAVEMRAILRILSIEMHNFLDEDIPELYPGLIAFDSYWNTIINDPVFRADPQIKEVIDCSEVLESRIENAISRKQYKPLAIRLIRALSVHRLTTVTIYDAIGATPEELRDRLFLFDPLLSEMGGDEPDKDLLTFVETVLKEILKTVSGQFISCNLDNNQYYLDLKKTEDFDTLIENRAASLSANQLDRYYFEALKRAMECQDVSYVTGYHIWQHELMWREHKAARNGYLFFGTPNERSTAVPRQSFYLYFIQLNSPPHFDDTKSDDEIFFRLKHIDNDFQTVLKNYAAAVDLSLTSSANTKKIYLDKSNFYLKKLNEWIQNHYDAFDVCYQGQSKSFYDWLQNKSLPDRTGIKSSQTLNFRDKMNEIAGICLAPAFENQSPGYPVFSIVITGANRKQAAQDALRGIANQSRTKQAVAVLDALQLLDGDKFSPRKSKYAQFILELMKVKGAGRVVNRSEIIENIYGVEYMDSTGCRLEPEFVIVILAALVYSGDIELSIPGKKFNATELSNIAAANFDDLLNFKHIEQPKDWNIPAIQALFELLSLAPGLTQLIVQGKDDTIQILQDKIQIIINRIIKNQKVLREGLLFWGIDLITVSNISGQTNMLENAKTFFDSLTVYNTPGKLKNFRYTEQEVHSQQESIKFLDFIEVLKDFHADIGPVASYLSIAEKMLPHEYEWMTVMNTTRSDIIQRLTHLSSENIAEQSSFIDSKLEKLKSSYIIAYMAMHTNARLGQSDARRKAALLTDNRLQTLFQLAEITLLPRQQLDDFKHQFDLMKTCFVLTQRELETNPACPHCGFNPLREMPVKINDLERLDEQLDIMISSWTGIILSNLESQYQSKSDLLKSDDKNLLQKFIHSQELPDIIDNDFIYALQQIFADLVRINLNIDDFKESLRDGPATPMELKARFENYVDNLVKGKNMYKVRIVVE